MTNFNYTINYFKTHSIGTKLMKHRVKTDFLLIKLFSLYRLRTFENHNIIFTSNNIAVKCKKNFH